MTDVHDDDRIADLASAFLSGVNTPDSTSSDVLEQALPNLYGGILWALGVGHGLTIQAEETQWDLSQLVPLWRRVARLPPRVQQDLVTQAALHPPPYQEENL